MESDGDRRIASLWQLGSVSEECESHQSLDEIVDIDDIADFDMLLSSLKVVATSLLFFDVYRESV